MADPQMENFTLRMIAEALFYDEEYGLLGSLSLIDMDARREAYVASFLPLEGTFLIEEATGWEDDVEMEDETDVAYRLAVESRDHGTYEVPEAAAQEVLALATEHDLLPSFTVLFEDEEL